MIDLLNVIGMTIGIASYAMLLAMLVRAGRASGSAQPPDPLLIAAALLGLVWNLCALPAYELPRLGLPGTFSPLTALGFSALGFLPAVVVHSVLRGDGRDRSHGLRVAVAVFAYGVAAIAATLHATAAWRGEPIPSAPAMRLLTYAFVILLLPLAAVTRRQPGSRRALWAAALSIFAVSALHLSQFERAARSWPVELVGHHASLPLAFAILYQDFPFALADLFLKRALTLLALVTTAFVAVATFGPVSSVQGPMRGARDVGVLVTLWVMTALLYPRLRDLASWFVDAVILRRPDYGLLLARINRIAEREDDLPTILDATCEALAPALSARVVQWQPFLPAAIAHVGTTERPHGTAAVIEIPVAEAPRYALHIGGLTGGRRLLSDDNAALAAIALRVGRRIDAIRITRERYDRELREQEISKLATEAELRALRAQINPHFLFNALTTIGYLIQTAPPRALDTLMRLTSLLRGVLRSESEITTLGRELELIEAYLDIEHARFEQRLRVHLDVPASLHHLRVPPLLLQPLVENAVKHGIAPERLGGDVSVTARLEGPAAAPVLRLTVHDTGAGVSRADFDRARADGIGLRNVERRLACQYGDRGQMHFHSEPGRGTTVDILLPADLPVTPPVAHSGRDR